MKYFNQDFKTKLYKAISNIENNSLVEVVAIVKPRSEAYADVPLWVGIVMAFIGNYFLWFSSEEYGDFWFYTVPILAFCLQPCLDYLPIFLAVLSLVDRCPLPVA